MNTGKDVRDTEKTNAISLPAVRANPFGSNISGEKAYRRAERITAAVYILTRYLSDIEPLKIHARESAHHLLRDVLELRGGFRMEHDADNITRIHACVREMISVAQLLSIAGYSSRGNVDMLTRALEELSQFVDAASTTTLSERTVLTKDDLLIDQVSVRSSARSPTATTGKRNDAGLAGITTGRGSATQQKGQSDVTDNNSGRKSAILEVLKDGKKMAIKDIASFVVGCSEKTIQRELASLVSDGTIRREGEKRWSRYFIPSINR